MLGTAHPWRVGLDEHADRAGIQRPPPAPSLTLVVTAATPIAAPAAASRTRRSRHDTTISPPSSSNSTASMTTPRSTPITRAHTLFDCTPFALALFPAFDSRKAKPGNGVHPRMVSYPPTERDGEPEKSPLYRKLIVPLTPTAPSPSCPPLPSDEPKRPAAERVVGNEYVGATRAFLTGDSALVRARPSWSGEDEPPGQRPLSEGCRHAVSPLVARRGARVGMARCPSHRWLRTPQASWPSRATRTRTPGGIVASCVGSRIAEYLWAPVLGCPTGVREPQFDGDRASTIDR